MDGKAGYQLMGDWEAADLDAKKFTDYSYSVFPGNGNTFQWLADSFVLPKGAPNPEGTKCWLKTVGSAAGQQAFNTKKGSIPARTDAAASAFPAYQQAAIADWKNLDPGAVVRPRLGLLAGLPGRAQLGDGQVLQRRQRVRAADGAGGCLGPVRQVTLTLGSPQRPRHNSIADRHTGKQ